LPRRASWKIPRLRGLGIARSLDDVRLIDCVAIVAVGLAIWGWVDIPRRGRIVPGHIEWHMTDFTVFTEAGAAFFDGRDPYEVANPRGWKYLYPPFLALVLAPLSIFDACSQVGIWFVLSSITAFGCALEAGRLWKMIGLNAPTGVHAAASARHRSIGFWVGIGIAFTVIPAAVVDLQRGQMGIVILYLLLLGARKTLGPRSGWDEIVGGLVFSIPVVMKVYPIVPIGCLLGTSWLRAIWGRGGLGSAGRKTFGVLGGIALLVLIIPGWLLGWEANVRHLRKWSSIVPISADRNQRMHIHVNSENNQSFSAALERMGGGTPPGRSRVGSGVRVRAGSPFWKRVEWGMRLVFAGLPCLAGVFLARRGGRLELAMAFGLGCAAPLLASPIAWTHYHTILMPTFLFLSVWVLARGKAIWLAWLFAPIVALEWSHLLAARVIGGRGLLGVGLGIWYFGVVLLAIGGSMNWGGLRLPKVGTWSVPAHHFGIARRRDGVWLGARRGARRRVGRNDGGAGRDVLGEQ
jgi:hypothetical protein